MGKYLDILARYDINDGNDKTPTPARTVTPPDNLQSTFGRICRFGRTFSELERRRPDGIEVDDWQQAVEDGRRFLAQWSAQAESLGWTARDLFGLMPVPVAPASFNRLARYDHSGLIWLLRGQPVVAITEQTAAIQSRTGAITIYRRHNKPALGPLGDSLDDFK